VRYPLIELCGGLLALLAVFGLPELAGRGMAVWGAEGHSFVRRALLGGFHAAPWVRSLSGLWLFLSLLAVLFIDLEHRIIPDEISLGGLGLGLVLSLWTLGLLPALLGMAAGAGALFLCGWLYQRTRGRPGMGLGDVKLAGMLGAFLGLKGIALTILMGSLLGSILGMALILKRRGNLSSALPFGTVLAPAAAIAFLWGPRIWSWYEGFFPGH